jgi:hypothetical protein
MIGKVWLGKIKIGLLTLDHVMLTILT